MYSECKRETVTWTQKHVQYFGGKVVPEASDTLACEEECSKDIDCYGVDYDYTQPAGQKCHLQGSYSPTLRLPMPGVLCCERKLEARGMFLSFKTFCYV